jgi:CRP-like cAMP-binding protein
MLAPRPDRRQPHGALPIRGRVWHHPGSAPGSVSRRVTDDGGGMATREELVDALAGFTLFGDLTRPQLTSVVHLMEEVLFAEGERVLRQGLTGSGFFVVLDGEASVVVDGTERAKLTRGDFFGEASILLGQPPIADVVALRPLQCLVLPGPQLEQFLIANPRVLYRMLQAQTRRLQSAQRFRS